VITEVGCSGEMSGKCPGEMSKCHGAIQNTTKLYRVNQTQIGSAGLTGKRAMHLAYVMPRMKFISTNLDHH